MPTDFVPLGKTLSDGGIRTVNFFNGRLLTGADLSREQQARREADARVGLAIGDGVARGLEVTYKGAIAPGGRPAAQVSAGVAINRQGRVLSLPSGVTLALARGASPAADTVACLFGECAPLAPGDYVAGQGLYLLTIAPAFSSEGRAAVSGVGGTGARCAVDATVEGVQFRLLAVPAALHGDATFGAATFRNRIAYRGFGEGVTAAWASDLLGADPRGDDLLDDLRAHGLRDDEVPLALLAFAGSFGHVFTDMWSVRRPAGPTDTAEVAANLADPRRMIVGRAMFRQFAVHLAEINLANVTARGAFRHLPPAGLIPLASDAAVARFFAGMTTRGPLHIDAHAVEPLLRESFAMPAIDTASEEAVWLYRIAQRRMRGASPMLLFACGHLAPRAEARFDLNYWDHANYALIP
jgi:hypothetical protein